MEPHCDKCIHRLVCKVIDRITGVANSMPMTGDEMRSFIGILRSVVADECPEWKRR